MHPRRGRANILGILIILVLIAGIGGGALFGPYYWDHMVVKEVTRTSALTYIETQIEEKAVEQLHYEAERRDLGEYFDSYEFCTAAVQRNKTFKVNCTWTAYVYYPFTDYYKALPFSVTSEVVGAEVETY